jgi:hypothetical protein
MTAKMMWNANDIPICERAKKQVVQNASRADLFMI